MPPPSPDANGSMRCLCATVRRASRLLNRRYEEALRPAGVSPGQFEMMMTLQAAGPIDQSQLAEVMEADQTTLSRNLKLLLKERWIEASPNRRDARRRTYVVTKLGHAVVQEAQHCWRKAHEESERLLGGPVSELLPMFERILYAARGSSERSA